MSKICEREYLKGSPNYFFIHPSFAFGKPSLLLPSTTPPLPLSLVPLYCTDMALPPPHTATLDELKEELKVFSESLSSLNQHYQSSSSSTIMI